MNLRHPKRKIINDPLYGLISINHDLVFDILQHPYFQRLKNIHQLGFSYFVYPGATHTRFQHSIGAMYLMQNALSVLVQKGIEITDEEQEAALAAILLHDVGHAAFSHALEGFFVPGMSHETCSKFIIGQINRQMRNRLRMTVEIIEGNHPKHFLHQLVSSQLDVDRLDYLNRDSFYTGVSEGVIGSERIIKMLHVVDNQLVAEEKAVYSIEKYIISRRLMYWQVYLHKTVHATEVLVTNILRRAKMLFLAGRLAFCSPSLRYFFAHERTLSDFAADAEALRAYVDLDDVDILYCIKQWRDEPDQILSDLSRRLARRDIFRIEILPQQATEERILSLRRQTARQYGLCDEDAAYYVLGGEMENRAYNAKIEAIKILDRNGKLVFLENISDHLNHRMLSESIRKYFICYPRQIKG
jgi:HD superfamily phosphohydrolase